MLSSMATADFGSRKVNFALADVPSVHQVQLTVGCSNNPQPEYMISSGKVLPCPGFIVSTLQAQQC